MKSVKKVISFILSLAMVLSIIVIPNTSSVSAADSTTYTYFNANMFKYNTSYTGATSASNDFNASTKSLEAKAGNIQGIYFNDGKKETTIKGSYRDININNENYNIWSGNWSTDQRNYACTGMAKSELVGGKIQFNYPQADIFDATTVVGGKSTYTNIGIPFKKDNNGNYYYNSDEYDVKFPSDKPESGVNLTVKSGNPQGFYPFSQDNTKSYHFGMNMGVNFYMTSNGHIDGDESKDPIKFEFSGDDDVWVFVDGKLVLDIGGIHDAIAGDIDFSTGKANVYVGKTKTVARTTNIYSSDILGSNWKNDEDKSHTLQVFYLERGQGKSNCKIKFNLPQRDKLEVAKILGNEVKNNDELGTLLQQKFQFQLLVSDTKDGTYKPCSNMKYNLISGTSSSKIGYTDSKGYFELGFGDRALFDRHKQIEQDKFYKVIEVKGDAYTTTWTSTINGKTNTLDDVNGNPIIQTLTKGLQDKTINSYNFVFKNTFKASATDDVVVLDYGKKVNIDVLKNDVLLGANKVISSVDSSGCQNGQLKTSSDKTKLVYEPKKFMNSIDEASYKVNINNVESPYDVTANVKIMPATSVYYEDDFGADDNDNPNVAIVWSGDWKTDGKSQDETQSDKNSQYGWDDSYKDDTGYSNGSAHYSSQKLASATFRFTGTGVDVYSRTNDGVGKISTSLKKVTKNTDGTEIVKTIKYKSIDNLSISGDYYQIPTLNYDDLDYGTYEVTIKVAPVSSENRGKYYLDGIRVYNPLGEVDTNSTAGKAYKEAGESNAQYIQVRKDLLDSSKVQAIDTAIKGSLFIDKLGAGTIDIGTYKDYGPKNEVYLKADTTNNKTQGVAFNINGYSSEKNKVFIGLKSPTGKEVTVKVTSGDKVEEIKLKSAADLYYQITPDTKGNVVIENMSDNLLSITKVRITGENLTANGYALTSTPELMSYVNTFDTLQEKQDTNQKDTEETLKKGDVDINNPGDNDTNKDNSSQDNNEQTKPDNTWNKIMNSIKSWFRK